MSRTTSSPLRAYSRSKKCNSPGRGNLGARENPPHFGSKLADRSRTASAKGASLKACCAPGGVAAAPARCAPLRFAPARRRAARAMHGRCFHQVDEARQLVARRFGEIGAGVKRRLVGVRNIVSGPAAARAGSIVDAPTGKSGRDRGVPHVDLDVDEQPVHHRRHLGILKAIVRHDVAPVAGPNNRSTAGSACSRGEPFPVLRGSTDTSRPGCRRC